MIGLEQNGEIVAATAHCPKQGLLLSAARGQGAWSDGTRLSVSGKKDPGEAVLSFNGFNKAGMSRIAPRLLPWVQRFWAVRSMGGAVDAMLVAQGLADVWIETDAAPWDLAPLKLGGRVFQELRWKEHYLRRQRVRLHARPGALRGDSAPLNDAQNRARHALRHPAARRRFAAGHC